MKRLITAISLVIAFPLIVITSLYLICRFNQPDKLLLAKTKATAVSTYIDEGKIYEISGDIECYPGMLLSPEDLKKPHVSDVTTYLPASSLDKKSSEYVAGSDYVATLRFYLNLPANRDYSICFPANFCEYKVYVNGSLTRESVYHNSDTPGYATRFYVDLPQNYTGLYEIVVNYLTPENYINNGTSTLLFSSRSSMERMFSLLNQLGDFELSIILFTILFTLIQLLFLGSDKRMTAFSLLSLATIVALAFMDGKTVLGRIPYFPHQLGTLLDSLSTPLFLIALLYYTYTMFPSFFPKKAGYIFSGMLILPLLDSLFLQKFPLLSSIGLLATIFPYALCLYVFVMAYESEEKFILPYGIGLLSTESSVLLLYSTQDLAIPSIATYLIGYIIFAVLMVAVVANEYAKQNVEEQFIRSELSRQLEAMQASENAFLNSQMKPHFLYNTLNTIADLCVTDSEKAKRLINSLGEYLKLILSMDSMDETVPLRRELEVVDAYTGIEKERFPEIKFFEEYPIRLPVVMVPPLSLQPLIENAIKHGVRKSSKPGVITLRIVESDEYVDFYVADNGVGMKEEQIKKLFNVPSGSQSIGIYNIDRRLKSKYGSGLHVESTPGLGTCVSFRIPR